MRTPIKTALALLSAFLVAQCGVAPVTAQTRGNAAMIDDWRTGTAQHLDTELGGVASSINTINLALPLKAPLASPVFTGDPQAPTPVSTDNDTSLATTAFVHSFVAAAGYVDSSTAQTIGGVKTFTSSPIVPTPTPGDNSTKAASTAYVQGELTQYAPLASPALTGVPTAPTAAPTTNTTQIATTAFVQAMASGAYQPLDSDLTAIAALTTTSYGRSLLTSASATALMNGLSATDLTTGTLPDGRLSNTVTAGGPTGSATVAPIITWDAHGRLTAVSSATITPAFGSLTGSAACSQLPALTGDVTASAGSCATTLATTQAGAHTWSGTQAFTDTAAVAFGLSSGAATKSVTVRAATAQIKAFTTQTGTTTHWQWGQDAAAETGSNVGGNWFLGAYDDSGVFLGFALTGTRSTRVLNFTVAPTFTDASTTRTNLGLGTLATQSGTFSGTSSGTNTGDETSATIKTKLGITTLSGSNTGDQTFSLTVPAIFTAGGSSTSALSFTLANQSANLVFAGPSTGTPGAPTFRALVAADMPTGVALLASPIFSGDPQAPSPAAGDNDTSIATSAFVTGALTSYAPLASPALTGTPTAPTASIGTNTSQIASTAFVTTAVTPLAPLASPALTGTPTAPTAALLDNTTKLATTAYVQSNLGGYETTAAAALLAPLASPALTGTPTVPTASAGTNTTQAASTAFVTAAEALDEKLANKGAASGYAPLDSSTLLAAQYKHQHVTVVSTATVNISGSTTFDLVLLTRAGGGDTVNLPSAPADGFVIDICDGNGGAATSADTLLAAVGATINGATSLNLASAYKCWRVTYISSLSMWIAR